MPPTLSLRLLSIPAVAAAVAAGVWVAGGVVTDDFRAAMALTGIWFALAGAACLLIARGSRAFRVPVVAGYLIAAVAIGGYLGLSTLRDRVVDEQVVVGIPRAAAPEPLPAGSSAPPEPRGNVELARARFRSGEHHTAGIAAVVRVPDGRRFLTLTAFATSPGPDLRVRLAPGGSADGGADGAVDLGALKGNRGDQQYAIPPGVRLEGRSVVIWCRAFSVAFGHASLR